MQPKQIKVLQKSRELHLSYDDDDVRVLPIYQVRAASPAADNKYQKQEIADDVNITYVEPVGHYGVKFTFDDGHDTGIYSWELLFELSHQAMA